MMAERKLSEILKGNQESLEIAWDRTPAAKDFEVLPAGKYRARIANGDDSTRQAGG